MATTPGPTTPTTPRRRGSQPSCPRAAVRAASTRTPQWSRPASAGYRSTRAAPLPLRRACPHPRRQPLWRHAPNRVLYVQLRRRCTSMTTTAHQLPRRCPRHRAPRRWLATTTSSAHPCFTTTRLARRLSAPGTLHRHPRPWPAPGQPRRRQCRLPRPRHRRPHQNLRASLWSWAHTSHCACYSHAWAKTALL